MRITKKLLVMCLVLTLALSCAVTGVYADSSNVKVNVGNRAVQFTGDLGAPFINSDGRTLVPFRAVANFMNGVNVEWDGDAREAIFYKDAAPVSYNNRTFYLEYMVRFPIDTNQVWETYSVYTANDDFVTSWDRLTFMDTKAIIKGGRTYAPIRFLAESFLYDVGWNNQTRTVLLTPPVERTWGQDMWDDDTSRGYPVTSQTQATYYAREFAKKCLRNEYTAINYTKEVTDYLEDEEDVTGWVFEFPEYNYDEVYINCLGETWYWDEDDEIFHMWY